ncbi:MAG: DUF4351 domain-containing protein [Chloroflexota bacterium]
MASPFDATTKRLFDEDPAAWLRYLGIPVAHPVSVQDSDLSTVRILADKVVRVQSDPPLLVQIELQSTYDPTLPARMFQYAAGLFNRERDAQVDVVSVALLLAPRADGPQMTGAFERSNPITGRYLTFQSLIVRAWQRPVEPLLHGEIATLPLAPLANIEPSQLTDLLRTMARRFEQEPIDRATALWNETVILMGSRFDADLIVRVLEGVGMLDKIARESSLVRLWLDEGRQEGHQEGRREGRQEGRSEGVTEGRRIEARDLVLRMGTRRWGPPPHASRQYIESISELGHLESLADRMLDARSWDDLVTGYPGDGQSPGSRSADQ